MTDGRERVGSGSPPPRTGGPLSTPTDTLTVVRDARGRSLTKSYGLRDERLVKRAYPPTAEFHAEEVPVDGIDSLASVLDNVTAGGAAAVIRGAPGKFYPRNGSPAFRLLMPQEGQASVQTGARISQDQIRRNKLEPDGVHRYGVTWLPTFEDHPRSWVIFDVDRIPVPDHMADDWVDEPEAAVEHVLGTLPALFRSAACWWSLSSSAAVPGQNGREVARDFKLKLAFWLDRPLTGSQVKRWMAAERAPVDPTVFGAVQLIYVARPGFGPGLHDPVPRRSGFRRGEVSTVSVPDCLPVPPIRDQADAAAFGPVEGLEDLCAALRDRLQGEPHVREHLKQSTGAYVRQHGPKLDQTALVDALEGVALEHRSPAEVAGYGVDRLVDYVVGQERTAAYVPFGRRAVPQAVLPPYFATEADNRFREVNNQRRTIRSWLREQHLFALARREFAARRQAAFIAEGLA